MRFSGKRSRNFFNKVKESPIYKAIRQVNLGAGTVIDIQLIEDTSDWGSKIQLSVYHIEKDIILCTLTEFIHHNTLKEHREMFEE